MWIRCKKAQPLTQLIILGTCLFGCSRSEFASQVSPRPTANGGLSDKAPRDSSENDRDFDAADKDDKGSTDKGQDGASETGNDIESDIDLGNDSGNLLLSDAGELCFEKTGDPGSNKTFNQQKGTSFYFENKAVDPGNTGKDLATSYNLVPYAISPSATLNKTIFELNSGDFKKFNAGGITQVEWFVFAHQFGSGLDTIELNVEYDGAKSTSNFSPNIYSAYGHVSVNNIRLKSDGIFGDIGINTFAYDPQSTAPHNVAIRNHGNVSAQVGTDIIGPASDLVARDVELKDVSLKDFKLTVTIDADTYDSVQYRSIQGLFWGSDFIAPCP